MSGFKLPQHARNHRTGGSDPIVFPPANLPFAVVSVTGTLASGTGSFPDLSNFDTNDTDTFEQDTASPFGILLKADGRFLAWAVARFTDPAGGAVEPQTSFMSCNQTSSNYNGSQSDWRATAESAQGVPAVHGTTTYAWNPWDTDLQNLGAAFVGPPYSDYSVSLYNAGTQTMGYTTALQVIRIGDASSL